MSSNHFLTVINNVVKWGLFQSIHISFFPLAQMTFFSLVSLDCVSYFQPFLYQFLLFPIISYIHQCPLVLISKPSLLTFFIFFRIINYKSKTIRAQLLQNKFKT